MAAVARLTPACLALGVALVLATARPGEAATPIPGPSRPVLAVATQAGQPPAAQPAAASPPTVTPAPTWTPAAVASPTATPTRPPPTAAAATATPTPAGG